MHPTDLEIEMYLVGDLDAEAAARIEDAASKTPALAAYLAERRAEQEAFALHRPRLTFDERPSWRQRFKHAWAPVGIAAVAAGFAIFFLTQPPDESGLYARGSALSARLIAKREAVVFPVGPQTPLRAGDRLRLEITLETPSACSAVGVDAKGASTVLHDEVPLEKGVQLFPQSVVLDDALGRERIIVGCSIAAAALQEAIAREDLARLQVPLAVLAYEKESATKAGATSERTAPTE